MKPVACGQCDGKLVTHGSAPNPRRHQVTELPEVKLHVTEYQLQFGWGTDCEDWSCAALPRGVPQGSFGPRLVTLIPPKRLHLTSWHGVFAPNATLRPLVTHPQPPESSAPSAARCRPEGAPKAPRRPRLDGAELQRRTFGVDVFSCHCGGKHKVLALITQRRTAGEILANMRLLEARPPPLPKAQGPPQLALSL